MSSIKEYISKATAGDAQLTRRLATDLERGGVVVTADVNDSYKKTIDQLLAKMKMKRAPLEGRVPVPYNAEIGEHDRKVVAGIDPLDGGKLEKVWVSDKREAMYNPRTYAVWPLPVAKGAPAVL
jgi:hypothetical protein